MYTIPGVSDFKSYFVRDFPYGSTQDAVMDADITNAMQDCAAYINPDLFQDQPSFNIGFFNLSAHFMVMSLRASSQGVAGQFSWLQNSKGAGAMSEGLSIPQRITDQPHLAVLTKTNYGLKYLFLILPQMVGVGFTIRGETHA
jgi:hypothetical protein